MSPRILHRRVGLAVGLLWCLQALTGVLLAFRWELDDATLRAPAVALEPAALAARIEAIGRERGLVNSVWTSGSRQGRFDIYYADAGGADRTLRVDGAGHPLRDAADSALIGDGELYNTLTVLHQTLFAGEAGGWIIGISGLLLLSNLAVGLGMAWPRSWRWRTVLLARPAGNARARLAGWHRLIGCWLALPALVIVMAGITLVFKDAAERALGAQSPEPDRASLSREGKGAIGSATVIDAALSRHPRATLTALVMPADDAPWYRVRLRTPDQDLWIWGTTTLYFSAADGRLLLEQPSATAPPARRLIDALYPIHTGQIGGPLLRVVVMLTGAGLVVLFILGLRAWLGRRAAGAPRQ